MSIQTKLLLILSFLAAAAIGFYFVLLPQLHLQKPMNATVSDNGFGWKYPVAKFPSAGSGSQIAYSDIRDPGGIPQGLPVRLRIPAIGVDSAIEDAHITPDGRMDVPAGSINVAWFALGPHPGQVGSAVIGGHFGISNGIPFVFYNLDKLKVGDKIYIVDDKGDTLAFQIQSTKSFDRNADATTVFTSSDGKAHLNLITCEGIWNQVNGTYPQRLVVFTDAIPSEGPVTVNKQPQVAAKLPVTAVAPAAPAPIPTERPTQAPSKVANSPTLPQVLIASAKTLYATPTDALITFLLLISIALIALRIIRK